MLKKIAGLFRKVFGIAQDLAPTIKKFLPAGEAATLDELFGVIVTAEGMVGAISDPNAKTGPQKLQAATPFIASAILQSEMLRGKKVKDESAFTAAVQQVTSGLVGVMNNVE